MDFRAEDFGDHDGQWFLPSQARYSFRESCTHKFCVLEDPILLNKTLPNWLY
jgi:hypothetical protein